MTCMPYTIGVRHIHCSDVTGVTWASYGVANYRQLDKTTFSGQQLRKYRRSAPLALMVGGIQRWPMKRVALNVESLSMSCCLSTYLQSFLLQDTRSERVQSPPCRHSGPPRTNPGHLCWRPSQTPLDQRSHRFPLETGTGTGPWTFHWGLSRKWLPRWPRWAECRRHWSWTDCLLGQFVKGPRLWLGGGAADLKQSQAEYG